LFFIAVKAKVEFGSPGFRRFDGELNTTTDLQSLTEWPLPMVRGCWQIVRGPERYSAKAVVLPGEHINGQKCFFHMKF
jgi:hypothetical protein